MGGLSGVIAGLVGSGQGEKTIDMGALLQTIQGAGQYQQSIINALPAEIQQQLQAYSASLNKAGSTYQQGIQQTGQNLENSVAGVYGPNSPAAMAEKKADTQSIYSTVPGTQNAVRNALAATGGLQRGQAGAALAAPYTAAAAQNSQAAAGVNASQAASGQQATIQALNTVNSMDANMFQQMFGMSQAQAQQILSTGNDALKTQLTQLINQSNNQTNQTLGVEGIEAQNGYQNALQQQANQGAIYNGLGNMAANGAESYFTGGAGNIFGALGGSSGSPDLSTVMGSTSYTPPNLSLSATPQYYPAH